MALDEGAAQRRERRDARVNRQRLLLAARDLFAANGVAKTNMSSIARYAKVGQGTLYRHFANKDELCLALIRLNVSLFQVRFDETVVKANMFPSPLTCLKRLVTEKVAITEMHMPLYLSMNDQFSRSFHYNIFKEPYHQWLEQRISGFFTEAINKGEIVDMDVGVATDSLMMSTIPQLYIHQRTDKGYTHERIINNVQQMFFERSRTY